jgi:hypothetical protein
MSRTFISGNEALGGDSLPKWDLSSIYLSFDAPEYRRDLEQLPKKIAAFLY